MGVESEGLRPTSVMIVDDQRYARLGLALMIRKAPDLRVVGEAGDGQEALEVLEQLNRSSGFLLKDVRAAQLAQAVRAVAQGDAVLTPRVTKELIARGVPRALSGAQREGLRERFGALTPREFDVVRLIAEGMSNEEIAERLVLQPASVRRNVSRILAKLHLRDRVQIAVAWYKGG